MKTVEEAIKRLLVNDVPGCDGEPQLSLTEAEELVALLQQLQRKRHRGPVQAFKVKTKEIVGGMQLDMFDDEGNMVAEGLIRRDDWPEFKEQFQGGGRFGAAASGGFARIPQDDE